MLGMVALSFSTAAFADPPMRVARLGYSSGPVSFSPAGDDEWVTATINRPLIAGDRLWADAGARDELEIGSTNVRMGGNSLITVLNLDDRMIQLQLQQGTLNLKVRHLDANDIFEIDTPNLALSIRKPGDYRIDVDPSGHATTVLVRKGQAEADGEGAAYVIDDRQSYRFTGTDLRDYQALALPRDDDFDHWAYERDRRIDNSVSARYVSHDLIGYEDLDENGTWSVVGGYGNVWIPSHVAADWAPYRDGHWAWVEPWGWTWVDDAPWGFTVSHYGRWAHMGRNWGWIPGPMAARAVYAPALVVFVGGSNFRLSLRGGNVGGVAWFPLGPREVYRPGYHVSQNYFTSINVNNTTINKINVTNVYNNKVTNISYINRQVPGAVIAVPATAFSHSQAVAKTMVRLPKERFEKAPITTNAAIAPDRVSVRGNGMDGHKPAASALERQVIAKTTPAPTSSAALSFGGRQGERRGNAGRPIDSAIRPTMPPPTHMEAPQIKVLQPRQSHEPLSRPPAAQAQALPAPAPPSPRAHKRQAVMPSQPPNSAAPTPFSRRGRGEQMPETGPSAIVPRPPELGHVAPVLPTMPKPAEPNQQQRPFDRPEGTRPNHRPDTMENKVTPPVPQVNHSEQRAPINVPPPQAIPEHQRSDRPEETRHGRRPDIMENKVAPPVPQANHPEPRGPVNVLPPRQAIPEVQHRQEHATEVRPERGEARHDAQRNEAGAERQIKREEQPRQEGRGRHEDQEQDKK